MTQPIAYSNSSVDINLGAADAAAPGIDQHAVMMALVRAACETGRTAEDVAWLAEQARQFDLAYCDLVGIGTDDLD